MRYLLVCLCIFSTTAAAGCELFSTTVGSDGHSPTEKIILPGDDEDDIPADAASVTDLSLAGNVLKVEVRYGGGCRNHEFRLTMRGGIVKTSPPGIEVYLSHKSNGDMCEALITEELAFDLLPLRQYLQGWYPNGGTFRINVHEPRGKGAGFEHVEMESPLYRL